MSTLRDRMKAYPDQSTNWEQLYVLTEHWKSDIQFYTDELRFLHNLIDKYYIWINQSKNLQDATKSKRTLQYHKKRCKDLKAKVGKHMIQLGYMIENPLRKDAGVVYSEHVHLEEELTVFYKDFRELRKTVRAKTERVMSEEELNRFLHN